MADWFRCRPLPLLDALNDLSDEAGLLYTKALLLIYSRDGRIPAAALRRTVKWRADKFDRVLAELLDSGKLIGTASGDLHNDYAMHELQQLAEVTAERAKSGSKGGRVRAERERQARKIALRNLSPDLFEGTEIGAELPHKSRRTRVKRQLYESSASIPDELPPENPNEINATTQAQLNHARASETETELEEDTPLVTPPSEIELVEGIVEDDEPGPRGRKQPMPPGWLPTRAALSERVQEVVAQWPEDEFDEQVTKFLEWVAAGDQRFVKWDRAFGNWCMKHNEQRRSKRHGKAAGFHVPSLG